MSRIWAKVWRLLTGETPVDPDYSKRMNYHLLVFRDGVFDDYYGAQTDKGVMRLLRMIALFEHGENIQVQVWDTRQEHWCRGDGTPAANGDGLMSLETTVHAGGINL